MRVLGWILLALVALVLILFAVSNREMVSVGLWPLPELAQLPLYLVVLGTLIVGFVAGQLVAWVGGWRWRREARRSRPRITALEEQIVALERELAVERNQRTAPAPVAALPR